MNKNGRSTILIESKESAANLEEGNSNFEDFFAFNIRI